MIVEKIALSFVILIAAISAGCVSPRTRFEHSYNEVVTAEDEIGRQLFPISPKTEGDLVANYMKVVCDQTRIANIHLYDSFREYEASFGESPTKVMMIREDILDLTRKHGAVLPVVRPIPDRDLVQSPRYTFPWARYLSPDDYIRFVDESRIRKSLAAQKAWELLFSRVGSVPAHTSSE